MLRQRVTINIDKFMELWEGIENKDWPKILPDWDKEMVNIFLLELAERFRQSKSYGSYTDLWDPSMANMIWEVAARNSTIKIPLSTMGYRASYAQKYPLAWVRSGELKDKIMPLAHGLSKNKDSWGIEIGIPEKTVTYHDEPWKDVPPDKNAYLYLEYQRSYIASSLILAWPSMIKKTLELLKK